MRGKHCSAEFFLMKYQGFICWEFFVIWIPFVLASHEFLSSIGLRLSWIDEWRKFSHNRKAFRLSKVRQSENKIIDYHLINSVRKLLKLFESPWNWCNIPKAWVWSLLVPDSGELQETKWSCWLVSFIKYALCSVVVVCFLPYKVSIALCGRFLEAFALA